MHNTNIDTHQARRAFNRSADQYDQAAILQREVATRLIERLAHITLEPQRIVDLGTGTGHCLPLLKAQYPDAHLIGVDVSQSMLHAAREKTHSTCNATLLCSDAERLPLAPASVDLVFSNLMLQWCPNLAAIFQEIHRILKPNGLFLFSTFGPDTLQELRTAWKSIDDQPHVHTFTDMHNIGDALLHTPFKDPVTEREPFTLTYATPKAVLEDLKQLGATYSGTARQTGLLGKQKFRALLNAYATLADNNDRVPATFEVIYGHAYRPTTSTKGNEIHIPVPSIS